MPEGAEVRLIAEYLNEELKNKELVEMVSKNEKFKKIISSQIKARLPIKIISVWTRGKLIVFECEDNIYFVNHLLMTGKWLRKERKYSRLELKIKEADGDKIFSYYFDDVRNFGKFEICWTEEELRRRLKTQGPDLMLASLLHNNHIQTYNKYMEPATYDIWLDILNNKRIGKSYIMNILKDNKRISGIGNYLRAEILYHAQISPWRTISSLSESDKQNIYNVTLDIMNEAYLAYGYTLQDFQHPNGQIGQFIPKIYNQTHDPDNNPIETIKIDGKQTMYWVPSVQH